MHPRADEFLNLYRTGMGVMRIAARLKMSGETARVIRAELGIEPRSSGGSYQAGPSDELLAAAERYLEGGISQPDVAALFRVRHYQLRYRVAQLRRERAQAARMRNEPEPVAVEVEVAAAPEMCPQCLCVAPPPVPCGCPA